jgi:hypothetical protein
MTAPHLIARITAALLLAITSVAGLAEPCASAAVPASVITKSAEQPAAGAHHHHDADQHAAAHHSHAAADSAPMPPAGANHDHAGAQACFIHCLSAALPAVALVRDAVIVIANHTVLSLPVLAGLRPMPLERPPNAAV